MPPVREGTFEPHHEQWRRTVRLVAPAAITANLFVVALVFSQDEYGGWKWLFLMCNGLTALWAARTWWKYEMSELRARRARSTPVEKAALPVPAHLLARQEANRRRQEGSS